MPIGPKGVQHLRSTLYKLGARLPGCFLAIASPSDVLFCEQSGPFDILQGPSGASVDEKTIIWLSSATRHVIVIAYLQLIDRGLISLDTEMTTFSPELAQATSNVLIGFDEQTSLPLWEKAQGLITLRHMLGDTSGFGPEFSPLVNKWKEFSEKRKGYINSCKIENLIHTPLIAQPGHKFQYGPNMDWLSYLFPRIAGEPLESYLETNIFNRLHMAATGFYPFENPELRDYLMPLRVRGQESWEVLKDQMVLHKLPRIQAQIEYPTGGSGLYSRANDFIKLLQHLLHPSSSGRPLLSESSRQLILQPQLSSQEQKADLTGLMNDYFALSAENGDDVLEDDDISWTLGLATYLGSGMRHGKGRGQGSVGWGGAGGTDFWIDPSNEIAVFFSTQMLPGSGPLAREAKQLVELAVYEALHMDEDDIMHNA